MSHANDLPINFSAILLAAGRSSRFGRKNKLLHIWQGKPLILHAIDNILQAGMKPIVVLGHEAPAIKSVIINRPVDWIVTPDAHAGMGTSIAAGTTALPQETEGIFICPADMPALSPEIFHTLRKAYNPQSNHHICYPECEGRRGHPVLFGKYYFNHLARLRGDIGARKIIVSHPAHTRKIRTEDKNIFLDIDSEKAAANLS